MNGEQFYDSHNPEVYSERLGSILRTEIHPENIDTFAQVAVNDLIELVSDVLNTYQRYPTIDISNNVNDKERIALAYFGLTDVDEILDTIIDKIDHLEAYNTVLSNIPTFNEVFIPTVQSTIPNGSGNFEEKKIIPRLKTLLYLLEHEVDIDINNITMHRGVVSPDMFRKESYVLVEIPEIERSVFVCDEEDNITFIFDTTKLNELGLNSSDIVMMNKSQIRQLLSEHSNVGRAIKYTKFWSRNVVSALEKSVNSKADTDKPVQIYDDGSFPIMPKDTGILALRPLAEYLGVTRKTILNAISALLELGYLEEHELQQYRNKGGVGYGFSEDQQALIAAYLFEIGHLNEKAPEDGSIRNASQIAKELSVSEKTVTNVITELQQSGDLGEVRTYKFKNLPQPGYTQEQQRNIYNKLLENNILAPQAPEDGSIVSIVSLAKNIGVSRQTIHKAIQRLQESGAIGDLAIYRFNSASAIGLDTDQQNIVVSHLATTLSST